MNEKEKDLKPTTYRLDETTKEKFKQIASDINGNQDDVMNVLINAYYLQNKQAELSEHKADIDKFQAYVTSIVAMYTSALQANHDTRELVKTEFSTLIESKDSLITDLQEKIKASQQDMLKAVELRNIAQQDNNTLQEQLETLTKTLQEKSERLEEQRETNSLLKNDLNTAKNDNDLLQQENTRMAKENIKIQELQSQLAKLQQDNKNLVAEKKQLSDDLLKQKNEFDKTIKELEQSKVKAVEWAKRDTELAVKEEYSNRIEKYRDENYQLKAENIKLSRYQKNTNHKNNNKSQQFSQTSTTVKTDN